MIFLAVTFTARAQTVTLSVSQTEPLQLNARTSVFNILKGNKQTLGNDLTITGGTAPYQVNWTSKGWSADSVKATITVMPQDTTLYTCKVTDAKGCTQEYSFQVNVVSPIVLKPVTTQISCYGKKNGAISLIVSGGAKPYTIAWADSSSEINRTKLSAGKYTVKVTDAMQQQQDTSVTLLEQAQIEVTLTASVCEGESYSFNGEKLTQSGNYKATYQTAGGCDSTIILNLIVNQLPGIPIITQKGNVLTSSAPTGNQWWKENTEITGATGKTLNITSSGNYKVTVANNNSCSSQSKTYSATFTSIASLETDGFICNIFPNPNNGLFSVEVEVDNSEPVQLELFSVDGKSVVCKQLDQQKGKQSVLFGKENLTKGVYTLQVRNGIKIVNRKLVVN